VADETTSLLQFEFRDYFDVVRRRKWTIIGAILIVFVTGVMLSVREQKIYRATAEVLVSTPASTANPLIKPDLPTEIRLLEGAGVHSLAEKQVPGVGAVSGAAASPTILAISVDDPAPARAATSVNAYVAAYTEFRRQQEVTALLSAAQATQTKIDGLGKQITDLNNQLEQQLSDVQKKYAPTPNESATAGAIRQTNLTRETNAIEDAIKPKRDSDQQQQILLQAQLQNLQVQSQQASQ
jgi:uncharacterized protein involved in exopolysaccharide biosynthesis